MGGRDSCIWVRGLDTVTVEDDAMGRTPVDLHSNGVLGSAYSTSSPRERTAIQEKK